MNKNLVIGSVVGLTLLFLSAKKKPGLKIIDIVNNLKKSNTQSYDTRTLDQVNKIVVHHSATTSGTPESYARYHVDTRNFPGIGYHYVIQQDGTIYLVNYLNTIAWHTGGENTSSVGICLTGNFDTQQPFPAQMAALKNLIAYLKIQFGRNLEIKGHRDYSTKTCPGNNIHLDNIAAINAIYKNVDCPACPDTFYPCNDGFFSTTNKKGSCARHGGLNKEKEPIKRQIEPTSYPSITPTKTSPKKKIKAIEKPGFDAPQVGDIVEFRLVDRNHKGFIYSPGKLHLLDGNKIDLREIELSDVSNIVVLPEKRKALLQYVDNYVYTLENLIYAGAFKWKNIKFIGIPTNPKEASFYLSNILDKKAIREEQKYVFFDETGITATDAHKLIHLNTESNYRGLFDENGNKIQDSYFNFMNIIADRFPIVYPLDLLKFMNFLSIVKDSHIQGKEINGVHGKIDGMPYSYNANIVYDVCSSLLATLGDGTYYIHLSNPNKPTVICKTDYFNKYQDSFGLFMPLFNSGDIKPEDLQKFKYQFGVMNIDYQRYLPYYWSFEKNNVVDLDNNIIDLDKIL